MRVCIVTSFYVWSKIGFQVAGRCRPLSKFMEFWQDLILMASVALLSQYLLTDLTTLAFPQSILCSFLATCTAIPLLASLLTTATSQIQPQPYPPTALCPP